MKFVKKTTFSLTTNFGAIRFLPTMTAAISFFVLLTMEGVSVEAVATPRPRSDTQFPSCNSATLDFYNCDQAYKKNIRLERYGGNHRDIEICCSLEDYRNCLTTAAQMHCGREEDRVGLVTYEVNRAIRMNNWNVDQGHAICSVTATGLTDCLHPSTLYSSITVVVCVLLAVVVFLTGSFIFCKCCGGVGDNCPKGKVRFSATGGRGGNSSGAEIKSGQGEKQQEDLFMEHL